MVHDVKGVHTESQGRCANTNSHFQVDMLELIRIADIIYKQSNT